MLKKLSSKGESLELNQGREWKQSEHKWLILNEDKRNIEEKSISDLYINRWSRVEGSATPG